MAVVPRSECVDDQVEPDLCSPSWSRRLARLPARTGTHFTIVDLFCGCGGLTLGAFEAIQAIGKTPIVAFAADTHQPSLNVYRRNFQIGPNLAQSVALENLVDGKLGQPLTQDEYKLVNVINRPDLLVAGPPCQGHSDLNNKTRRNDPRNDLYLRAVRFVEIVQPEFVLIENVPGAAHDKNMVVQTAEKHLRACGYATQTLIVSGNQVCLPQSRRRLFLLASRQLTDLPIILPQSILRTSISDWIRDIQSEYLNYSDIFRTPSKMSQANKQRADYLYENDIYDLPNELRPPCHRDNEHSYNAVYGRLRWDSVSPTITTGFGCMGQGRFLHPEERRVITAHEAARLQTFPDFFDFSSVTGRGDLQKMIGNAVPPKMAAVILYSLLSKRATNGKL